MNYVERHFGDWAKDTAHLTMLEDGAYNRLCDLYYVRETPLPADLAACCRLVRATSKQERDAVASVLREFFDSGPDGWTHKRCDAEIERFRTKSGKASASAKARWDAHHSHTERNANAYTDAMRPQSEGNATRGRGRARSHSPSTNTQEPEQGRALPPDVAREPETNGQTPTPAGTVCKAMRQAGMQAVNPGDPRLLALLEQGATEAEFAGIAAEAVDKGKGFAWVLAVLQSRRAEAAEIALAPPPAEDPEAWKRSRSGVINRANAIGFPQDPPSDQLGWQRYVRDVIAADVQHRTGAAA